MARTPHLSDVPPDLLQELATSGQTHREQRRRQSRHQTKEDRAANAQDAKDLTILIGQERQRALLRIAEGDDHHKPRPITKPLARAFRAYETHILRQAQLLINVGNLPFARRYIMRTFRRFQPPKDLRTGRTEPGEPTPRQIQQWYEKILCMLGDVAGQDDPQRLIDVADLLDALSLSVSDTTLDKWLAVRRKETLAREITRRYLRLTPTAQIDRILTIARKSRYQ